MIRNRHSSSQSVNEPFRIEKIGQKCNLPIDYSHYLPGQCFIHKELSYRGVILKSIPCDISVNEVTQEEKTYIHLVFADEFETNDRNLVDLKLGKQFHKKMGGELYSLDLVESKDIIPIEQMTAPVLNRSLVPFFSTNTSVSYSTTDADEFIYSYQSRLRSVKYLQDQVGQNVQIMKRTYKRNHLYEVYSTLTCYKLKDNPTGSSNWLISVRFNEAVTANLTNARVEIFIVQDQVRTFTLELPHVHGSMIQCNQSIKLLAEDKAAFCYAIITYQKEGWPKEYRLRSNIGMLFPRKAMQLLKGDETHEK